MAVTYLRVLQVVATNPGVVPSPYLEQEKRANRKGKQRTKQATKTSREYSNGNSEASVASTDYLDRGAIYGGRQAAPNGLEQYYNRDIFECEIDGMPRWCSTCKIWKPDRTHHSSEVGRCVYKMDHFCPWAGGIISETTYKFFIQFLCYGMLYCIFTLVVSVYYIVQRHREVRHPLTMTASEYLPFVGWC
jgi:palmitoyltransferase